MIHDTCGVWLQLQVAVLLARFLEFRANIGGRLGIVDEHREALGGK